jgi:hypothetical protein
MNRIEAQCFALLVTPIVGLNFAFFFSLAHVSLMALVFSMTISCVSSLDSRGWNCVPLSKKNVFPLTCRRLGSVWVEVLKFNKHYSTFVLFDKKFLILD